MFILTCIIDDRNLTSTKQFEKLRKTCNKINKSTECTHFINKHNSLKRR